MVKVMRSIVRGPLAPYVAGFAEESAAAGLYPDVGRAACLLHRPSGSLDVWPRAWAWTDLSRADDRAVSG